MRIQENTNTKPPDFAFAFAFAIRLFAICFHTKAASVNTQQKKDKRREEKRVGPKAFKL